MAKANGSKGLQTMAPMKEKKRIGRPPRMADKALQLEICARISAGETLTKVCKDSKMPARQTVTSYLVTRDAEIDGFGALYRCARESLLDVYADEIITISDDGTTDYIIKTGRNGHEYEAVDQDHIQRSRLRVDSRKWLLSKLRPEQYGDRMIAEQTGSVTVRHDVTTLSEREKMRRFALFMMEDQRHPVIVEQADNKETKSLLLKPSMDNDGQAIDPALAKPCSDE